MTAPRVHLETDPSGTRYLAVLCPECGETSRHAVEGLGADVMLECACGTGFNLTGESYHNLRRALTAADGDAVEPS